MDTLIEMKAFYENIVKYDALIKEWAVSTVLTGNFVNNMNNLRTELERSYAGLESTILQLGGKSNIFDTAFSSPGMLNSNEITDALQKAKTTVNKAIGKLKSEGATWKVPVKTLDIQMQKHHNRRVFIVHGHDDAMKQSVARILEKLGLEPVILHEQASKGKTIIEKFTDYSDVSFAVVLLSPDDSAFPKGTSPEHAKPRARQNVILELGYFLGKLGRNRVLPLYRGGNDFEMPSDYNGVVYTPFDDAGNWRFNLVRELKACEFDIDANVLL